MHKSETPRAILLIVATTAVASVLISGVLGWWFSHSPRQIVGHIDQPLVVKAP
jgi:hypothetical protein